MKNEPIYNTKQIAEMFQVATSTIFYWKKHGKLVEYTKDKNGQKLFRQSDIISFIKRTNNGDYAPSSIDVFYALDYMGLKNVIERSIPLKNEGIYNTKQIAEMFQVTTSTIWYWKKQGKLVEYTIDKDGQKLFRQSDIISFIKRTNNGDYAPSSIDVFYALDYMGLKNVIEHSIPFRNKYKTQYEIRIPDDNSHVITDRMDYIKKVSLMKFNTN